MSQLLSRTFGLKDLIMIVIGTVIGSGIFIMPAMVLRQTGGSVGLAIGVWTLAGVLSFLGALTYGELGAMMPEAGGIYVYLRNAFGAFPAFLYGWTLFFVMSSGAIAILSIAFASYLGQLLALPRPLMLIVAILMTLTITIINVIGTRKSIGVQNWTTGVKVGAILIMSVILIFVGKNFSAIQPAFWPNKFEASLLSGVGLAMLSVLWAYEGWQYVTSSAGEVIDPQRVFARGLALGTAALVGLYLLANFAYLAALSPERVMQSERVAAEAVETIMGPLAGKLIAVAIMVSMFSAANAVMLTTSRVYFMMARDGLFFQRLAQIHPRYGTPVYAVIFSGAWAIILLVSGTFEQLITYVIFTGWIFYALAAASIFVYRRRPEMPRPFRTPGYPWTPLVFILVAVAVVANALISQPTRALLGLGIVLLGAPAYFFWKTQLRRQAISPT